MVASRRTVPVRAAARRQPESSARLRLARRRSKTGATREPVVDDEFPPLTKAQIAELDRRVAELNDPTRYLVVSSFMKRLVLYYDVESNGFAHNRPEGGTAFKSFDIAQAVLTALSVGRRKRKDDSLQIIRARKTKAGIRLLEKPVCWLDRLVAASRTARRRKIENRKSKIQNS
jgi:hypothetical protein